MLEPSRALCWKIAYQWRLHCVLSVSCIKILLLIYSYCKRTFWFTFLHRLHVYNHFQDVQYSTTKAIQDLAQTGLAVQSHKVWQRTNRPSGHYTRTHQEGKCCIFVHIYEMCNFNSSYFNVANKHDSSSWNCNPDFHATTINYRTTQHSFQGQRRLIWVTSLNPRRDRNVSAILFYVGIGLVMQAYQN